MFLSRRPTHMVSSPDQTDSVDDEVQVFPTAAAAQADVALFDSAKTAGCFTQLFEGPFRSSITQGLGAGQSLASVNAAPVAIGAVGQERGDIRISVVIAQPGGDINLYIDIVVVVEGRIETDLSIDQAGVLAVPQLGAQLAGVAATRMAA
jgi:hypothetical protein